MAEAVESAVALINAQRDLFALRFKCRSGFVDIFDRVRRDGGKSPSSDYPADVGQIDGRLIFSFGGCWPVLTFSCTPL